MFLLSDTHEGTSSGRLDHKFGFKAHIFSIYCTGFTILCPNGVSNEAPNLLLPSAFGMHITESLGIAINPYSGMLNIPCTPPMAVTVLGEGHSQKCKGLISMARAVGWRE
jgi:hypothetical protein